MLGGELLNLALGGVGGWRYDQELDHTREEVSFRTAEHTPLLCDHAVMHCTCLCARARLPAARMSGSPVNYV